MKRIVFAALAIFALLCCDKGESPAPVITYIGPGGGVAGATVYIKGKYFSEIISKNIIRFNGLAGSVTAATDTSLTAVVPKGATTGKIKLTVNEQSVTSEDDFIVYTPEYVPNVTVSTLSGGVQGYADGPIATAKFDSPHGIAVDAAGNIYLTDGSNKIRKISTDGIVSLFAGSTAGYADGVGTAAKFNQPFGLAVDAAGNVYVADMGNNKIRKITPDGNVTTLAGGEYGYADGKGDAALFMHPEEIDVDADGNAYIADTGVNGFNYKIRKLTSDGNVTTPYDLKFWQLHVAVDLDGNVYAGGNESSFVKITPDNTITYISHWWGGYLDGPGASAHMSIFDLSTDNRGNLFVADCSNYAIRKIGPDGYVTTVAGGAYGNKDGIGSDAQFDLLFGVASDSKGTIYVAETLNHRIRKIVIE